MKNRLKAFEAKLRSMPRKRVLAAFLVLLVAVAAAGYYFFFLRSAAGTANIPPQVKAQMKPNEQVVESLPQKERLLKNSDEGYLNNPFSSPMVLVGVLESAQKSIATLRSGNTVYNVEVGDIINGTWQVKEIYLDRVYLSSGQREIMLKLQSTTHD